MKREPPRSLFGHIGVDTALFTILRRAEDNSSKNDRREETAQAKKTIPEKPE
jgi:hypothetical protein